MKLHSRALPGVMLLLWAGPLLEAAQVAPPAPLAGPASQASQATATPSTDSAETAEQGPLPVFPIPAGARFGEHVIGARDPTAAPALGRLIYSNTLGSVAISAGTGLIADDIATTGPTGCKLAQFAFEVSGRPNPAQPGGPFNVMFALYDICPGAVSSATLSSRLIVGTAGSASFPDEGLHTVVVVLSAPVPVPNQLWLGLQFSRTNAGPIVGAPAQEGISQDLFHYPGLSCAANLGEFPYQPHASFNVRLWAGTDEPCPATSLGYYAHWEKSRTQAGQYNPGLRRWVVDDLILQHPCRMVGYQVTVTDQATFDFEFRTSCDAPPIEGTQRSYFQSFTDNQTRNLAFAMEQPIELPSTVYFAASVSNSVGKILAGTASMVGNSSDTFDIQDSDGGQCVSQSGSPGGANLSITVLCEGPAPTGACCDMFVPVCVGGADSGKACRDNSNCAAPGSCERVCRVLPEANCTFPPPAWNLSPRWVEGATCDPEPFAHPCGQAACCTADDTCEDLTENECEALEPPDQLRQWQLGGFCGEGRQRCPHLACFASENPCAMPHNAAGCTDTECCDAVCDMDPLCCRIEWDEICVEMASDLAGYPCEARPPNDECWSTEPGPRALEVAANSRTFMSNATARAASSDPPICCYNDVAAFCVDGPQQGLPCSTHADCSGHGCDSEQSVRNTVWFKFTATQPAVQFSTANADSQGDTILQVFAAGDSSTDEAACSSLIPIGCADDCAECGEFTTHGRLCLSDVTPGETYYVMVGSKRAMSSGVFRLDIISDDQCLSEIPWRGGDCNVNGSPDGCDLATNREEDCDKTSVPDSCELATEVTFDCDSDALPDNCELPSFRLEAPGYPSWRYGYSVAIDGNFAFVGEPSFGIDTHLGRIHWFRRQGPLWSHAGTILSPNAIPRDEFGVSVAAARGSLWVGAPLEGPSGAVYVFSHQGYSLQDAIRIVPPGNISVTRFGSFLAAHGDRVITTASETSSDRTLVLVYALQADEWGLDAVLAPAAPLGINKWLRSPVDIWDRWIAINTEPISIFRRTGDDWVEQPPIEFYPTAKEQSAGTSLALQDDLLVVADCRYNERVFVPFRRVGRTWLAEPEVPIESYCQQAMSIDIEGSTAAVIAPHADGWAVVFRRLQGLWRVDETLPGSDRRECPSPVALAMSAGRAIVGRSLTFCPWFGEAGETDVLSIPPSDCNANSRPDACEFRDGTAADCNHNHVPDECDALAPFDSDFDGDADLWDAAGFANCFTAASGSPRPGTSTASALGPCCNLFDAAPPDSAIDLSDFAALASALTGP